MVDLAALRSRNAARRRDSAWDGDMNEAFGGRFA
jgi:hypothetical protein